MLKVEEIKKKAGGKEILKGVSIECRRGEIIGLLGPNGAGKTTTLLTIIGFQKPDSGKIFLDGEDITHLPVHKRAEKGIVFLPQESSLFDDIDVYGNFKMACELAKIDTRKIYESAEKFGITELLKKKVKVLSGGEKRKSEIARLFMLSPKFLILDEPFAGIDPKSIQMIMNIIQKISHEENIGVIISDHNVKDVMKICSKIYLIYDGKILEEGSPEKILSSLKAKDVFFGENFSL